MPEANISAVQNTAGQDMQQCKLDFGPPSRGVVFQALIALIRIFGLKEFARAVPVPRGCIASELIGLRQRLRLLSERLTIENNVR